MVYLARLVQWLDTDPWPQFRGDGPELLPSQIERKLQVTGHPGEMILDADELSDRCARLVILGGSGTGKTWLAKRVARRCAEAALARLAAGASLGEVELPLFTTCEHLLKMPSGDEIRTAIARSALTQLPGLGGPRASAALRTLFEERDGPTLLVFDSLDEAPGAGTRIWCAHQDVPNDWRIILTSRPAAWNVHHRPIRITKGNPAQQVGTLRPLQYPDDVDPVIATWLAHDPAAAVRLAAQIQSQPRLQQAATVPLILKFFCILGGDQPLPDRRAELCAKVINRLLKGWWRGNGQPAYSPDACRRVLRGWAWSAARRDKVSGTGAWDDEFAELPVTNAAALVALDHVAVPQGPADTDTDRVTRRFVHRMIQEHLVAEYVAGLPADEACDALFNHLWYDPDWEYAAPVGMVLHPERDEVLRGIIRRLTGGEYPGDIAALDGCWEVRRFLVRVTRESAETDWSPDVAAFLVQARTDCAALGDAMLVPASRWPGANHALVQTLLARLERLGAHDGQLAYELVDALAYMGLRGNECARLQAVIMKRLMMSGDVTLLFTFNFLASVLARLNPSDEERARVRALLLERLVDGRYADLMTIQGTPALASLAATAGERSSVLEELITMLPRLSPLWRLAHLDHFASIIDTAMSLDPSPAQRRRLREGLLSRLPAAGIIDDLSDISAALARLEPTREDRAAVLEALIEITVDTSVIYPPSKIASTLDALSATDDQRERVHDALRVAVRRRLDSGSAYAPDITEAMTELGMAEEPVRARVRDALVVRLLDADSVWRIPESLRMLVPSTEMKSIRTRLATALAAETDPRRVQQLAEAGIALCPNDHDADEGAAREIFRVQALEAVLQRCEQLLRGHHRASDADSVTNLGMELAHSLTSLVVTTEDRARAFTVALEIYARTDSMHHAILSLTVALTTLADAAEERQGARTALLAKLVAGTQSYALQPIVDAVMRLGATDTERVKMRAALIGMLARGALTSGTDSVAREVARLNPGVADIAGSRDWVCRPTTELLAAVRRNSPLPAWIGALPELSTG